MTHDRFLCCSNRPHPPLTGTVLARAKASLAVGDPDYTGTSCATVRAGVPSGPVPSIRRSRLASSSGLTRNLCDRAMRDLYRRRCSIPARSGADRRGRGALSCPALRLARVNGQACNVRDGGERRRARGRPGLVVRTPIEEFGIRCEGSAAL